jgi:hypothetical protein
MIHVMTTAAKILIVGGMANLVFAIVTGLVLARVRLVESVAPKYLALAHMGGLMWAPILLSTVVALELSTLPSWLETLAASLLVAGSVVLDAKDVINWGQHVDDEFQTKGTGYTLGTISGTLMSAGVIIITIGVLKAL